MPSRFHDNGAFVLDTPEGPHRPLAIAADGYQYRETFLRGGEVRRDVDIVEPDRDPPTNVTYLRGRPAEPLQKCDALFLTSE